MPTPNPSTGSSPPSNGGDGNSFLVAVGLFLAEHGHNANFSGSGGFTIVCNNPNFQGSLTGPCRIICCLEEGHVLDIMVGDSLMAFEKDRIDLFDPQSFDKLLALVQKYERPNGS